MSTFKNIQGQKIDNDRIISYLDKLEGMELEYDPEQANTGGVREFSWVDEETGTSGSAMGFNRIQAKALCPL